MRTGKRPAKKKVAQFKTVTVDVIRGLQSGCVIYTAMWPIEKLGRMWNSKNEQDIPVTMRRQRDVSPARVKKLVKYLMQNPKGYILPSLTVLAHPVGDFKPARTDSKFGTITIGSARSPAELFVVDGQHRQEGLLELARVLHTCKPLSRQLKAKLLAKYGITPSDVRKVENILGEHIPVMIRQNPGTERSQQMFTDINANASKPTGAQCITFDHRDDANRLARAVVEAVPQWRGRISLTQNKASGRQLYSIKQIVSANKVLVNYWPPRVKMKTPNAKHAATLERMIIEFWKAVADAIQQTPDKPYRNGAEADTVKELRASHMAMQGIFLEATARAFASDVNATLAVQKLANIDWAKNADHWQGGVMIDGRMQANRHGIDAFAAVLVAAL